MMYGNLSMIWDNSSFLDQTSFRLSWNISALIKKKTKFSWYKRKASRLTVSSFMTKNICAFNPSSYMTLQPLPSEFPYRWGKFYFIFYKCRRKTAKNVNLNGCKCEKKHAYKICKIESLWAWTCFIHWDPPLLINMRRRYSNLVRKIRENLTSNKVLECAKHKRFR